MFAPMALVWLAALMLLGKYLIALLRTNEQHDLSVTQFLTYPTDGRDTAPSHRTLEVNFRKYFPRSL